LVKGERQHDCRCSGLLERRHAGDGIQRPLRSRCPPRLMPSVQRRGRIDLPRTTMGVALGPRIPYMRVVVGGRPQSGAHRVAPGPTVGDTVLGSRRSQVIRPRSPGRIQSTLDSRESAHRIFGRSRHRGQRRTSPTDMGFVRCLCNRALLGRNVSRRCRPAYRCG
jgi:hypothetical protein